MARKFDYMSVTFNNIYIRSLIKVIISLLNISISVLFILLYLIVLYNHSLYMLDA